jgi:small conductance mechanosensitive channel
MLLTYPLGPIARMLDKSGDRLLEWIITRGFAVLVTVVVAMAALRVGTALIDRIDRSLEAAPSDPRGPRARQRAKTLTGILRSTLRAVILFAAVLSLLSAIGINITPLLASAGVVGLALGFGAQSLVKDVIAGFFILLEDQYGVGDVVDIDGKGGVVEDMNLRITQLRGAVGEVVTIPNGSIKIVTNSSKEWARAVLELTIDHATDIDQVLGLIVEEGTRLHLDWPDRVIEDPEVVGVLAIAENGTQLKALMKTQPLKQYGVAAEWRRRVKYALDRAGIRPAVPQRQLTGLDGHLLRAEEPVR